MEKVKTHLTVSRGCSTLPIQRELEMSDKICPNLKEPELPSSPAGILLH